MEHRNMAQASLMIEEVTNRDHQGCVEATERDIRERIPTEKASHFAWKGLQRNERLQEPL